MQRRVLTRILSDADSRNHLGTLNPVFATTFADSRHVEVDNRKRIVENYALEPSGDRLLRLYDLIRSSATGPAAAPEIDEQMILDRFLSPTRFRLLRSL